MVFLALLALTAMLSASGASAQSAADKAMAQRIGSSLKDSGELRDYRVGVKFQEGVAWLTGTVADAQQAEAAVRVARQINGVSHVISQLEYPSQQTAGATDLQGSSGQIEPASGVTHAYADTSASQRGLAVENGNQQFNRARLNSRNNMPQPMNRMPSAGHPVRQASAQQGVYQAGGPSYPSAGAMGGAGMGGAGGAMPAGFVPHGSARGPSYDNAQMPGYAWPSYASYPNYAAITYPQQYSPTAWPYIGPFYPYPQVPLAWRKVSLEWDDGWWFLDFSAHNSSH
jgi:hypothetical protein